MMEEQYQEEEEEGENERGVDNGGGVDFTAMGRFYGWPSSRIVRVSRACGGKDRHSKVLTSKGLRDRRVRLSVNTAIQFYDLQDRLGYDQPSKAVEWLLKAAASSINELPPMSILFPDSRKQLSEEKRSNSGGGDQHGFESPEVEMDDGDDPSFSQHVAMKSSSCSAISETCKGSGLSLSRSRKTRDRVAEKEKGNGSLNPISQTTSFTELLNAGITTHNGGESYFFMKSSPTPMDYFSSGLLSPATARASQVPSTGNHFPGFGVSPVAEHHQSELQHFSFAPDNLVHAMNSGSHDYSMNGSFSVSSSSGFAGFNRGTLQSNSSSPSMLPPIQRFPDGSPPSFFIGADDHNHQFLAGYEGRQELCYSNKGNQKLRGKN